MFLLLSPAQDCYSILSAPTTRTRAARDVEAPSADAHAPAAPVAAAAVAAAESEGRAPVARQGSATNVRREEVADAHAAAPVAHKTRATRPRPTAAQQQQPQPQSQAPPQSAHPGRSHMGKMGVCVDDSYVAFDEDEVRGRERSRAQSGRGGAKSGGRRRQGGSGSSSAADTSDEDDDEDGSRRRRKKGGFCSCFG